MYLTKGTAKRLIQYETIINTYTLIENDQRIETLSGLDPTAYKKYYGISLDTPLTPQQLTEIDHNKIKWDTYEKILTLISDIDIDNTL